MTSFWGRLRALRRDRRGVATIEFALWISLFFAVMLATLDIAQFAIQRGRLAQAMSGVSLAAFKTRQEVDYAGIPGYVRAASGLANPSQITVNVGCNGGQGNCTNTSRSCACLSRTGQMTAAAACGQPCGNGASASSQSGYYLQVTASYPFRPVALPHELLNDGILRQVTTVRLQ